VIGILISEPTPPRSRRYRPRVEVVRIDRNTFVERELRYFICWSQQPCHASFGHRIKDATPATPGYDLTAAAASRKCRAWLWSCLKCRQSSGHLFCAGLIYCIWADPTQNAVTPVWTSRRHNRVTLVGREPSDDLICLWKIVRCYELVQST
jgi:hypothetical protein